MQIVVGGDWIVTHVVVVLRWTVVGGFVTGGRVVAVVLGGLVAGGAVVGGFVAGGVVVPADVPGGDVAGGDVPDEGRAVVPGAPPPAPGVEVVVEPSPSEVLVGPIDVGVRNPKVVADRAVEDVTRRTGPSRFESELGQPATARPTTAPQARMMATR